MNAAFLSAPLILLLSICPTACTSEAADQPGAAPAGAPPSAAHAADVAAPATWQGKVLETMDSGGYTYAQVDTGARAVWIAGPQTPGVTAGQTITAPQGFAMKDFRSDTLQRDFAEIWFVSAIQPEGGAEEILTKHVADAHSGLADKGSEAGAVEGIAAVEGGRTVADILANRTELAGKPVKVRGKVVKYNSAIMGTNWAHIQDGSGADGKADLTITTDTALQVGDVVVVEGTLTVDKDFGAGYRYAAIVEKASVAKE